MKALPEHVEIVMRTARAEPGVESVSLTDMTMAVEKSMLAQSWFLDDQLVCMWGIRPYDLVVPKGYLWMATTKAAESAPFLFARYSKMEIDRVMAGFELLYGMVNSKYKRSQKWLEWLGFELLPMTTFHGEKVYPFRRVK